MVMMTIHEAEMGGPADVDLLDKAGRAEMRQGPVHCYDAKIGAGALGALPDDLTRRQMAACRKRLKDRQALGRHPQFGLPEERNEAGLI